MSPAWESSRTPEACSSFQPKPYDSPRWPARSPHHASACAGTRPSTVVPRPGVERTSSMPPRAAMRSDIFCSPEPEPALRTSKPGPSSATANVSQPSSAPRSTRPGASGACLARFWSASRQQKYTPASASGAYRRAPIPSLASRTSGHALATYASSAAGDTAVDERRRVNATGQVAQR